MSHERLFNFSAGPAVLPMPVLEQIQRDMLCLPGVGASILEISHRSKTFMQMLAQAEADLRELLALPNHYRVLFLQGGASLQFSMLAMNFLRDQTSAAYVRCGSWAKKAISEAKKEGLVHIAWNGESEGFSRMPQASELDIPSNSAYVHITSNETIEGVALTQDLETGDVPVFCDASSDFLSRPLDINKYALIYAGAQKNIGPAGCTVVILREDLLERIPAGLPSMLDYRTHADNGSLYNTPPAFAIYGIGLVAQWLKAQGGLKAIHAHNQTKANLLYHAIDNSTGFYRGHAQAGSRSIMNVTFRLPSEELEAAFVKAAAAEGLVELKGHRSVGGIRASIYNAFPLAGVEALAQFMQTFQAQHA